MGLLLPVRANPPDITSLKQHPPLFCTDTEITAAPALMIVQYLLSLGDAFVPNGEKHQEHQPTVSQTALMVILRYDVDCAFS